MPPSAVPSKDETSRQLESNWALGDTAESKGLKTIGRYEAAIKYTKQLSAVNGSVLIEIW